MIALCNQIKQGAGKDANYLTQHIQGCNFMCAFLTILKRLYQISTSSSGLQSLSVP